MPITMLSAEKHKNLRICTAYSEEYGDNAHTIPVILSELKALCIEYPICVLKDQSTGQFGLYVLTGFDKGENLFLKGNQWSCNYVPLNVVRQPFSVGMNKDKSTFVAIQLDHKRVSYGDGEQVFDEHGNASPYLRQISDKLSVLYSGTEQTKAFISALLEHNLLVQQQLNIKPTDGEQKTFQGFYTINDEVLQNLTPDEMNKLNQMGFLRACFFMSASVGNIQKLISLKQVQNK